MASNARQYATGGANSTLDADYLDSLTSLDFLRSNVDQTFTGNLILSGNLTVQGSTTTVESETLIVADNTIVLNSDYVGDTPSENAGIEINRGAGLSPNVSLLWDEGLDKWTLTTDGTNYYPIITSNDSLGNAGTADAWTNAMTLNVTGGSTGSVAFDGGTTPVAINLTPRIATSTVIGAVRNGANIAIDASGIISTHAPYSLVTASTTTLGGIKVGANLVMTGEVLDVTGLDNYQYWNMSDGTNNENILPTDVVKFVGGTSCATNYNTSTNTLTINSVDTVYEHPHHSGDVVSINDGATTIQPNVVNFSKMQDIAQNTIIGRITASTGDPEALTATQTKTILSLSNVENTALSTWAGSANITTLGTISTGTWNGTAIADAYITSAATWHAKQDGLTFGIANNNSVVINSISVASGEYAKFTTSGLESKSFAEVKSDLSLNLVENVALSTWDGSTSITTVGTITTGIWNGTAISSGSLDMDSIPTDTSTKPVESNGIFDALATKALLAGSLTQDFNALNMVVEGNLTVNGSLTTISTATLQVEDKNIELGYIDGTSETDVSADGGGITLQGTTDKTILWVNATDSWTFNQNVSVPSLTVTSTALVTNLNADLLDSQTGSYYLNASNINAGTINDAYLPASISSDITGNAATATALATTRTFDITGDLTTASVNFNGTANVTLVPTINNDAVTYAKIQNVVTANTLLGSTAANGIVTELSATTVRTLLGIGAGSTYDYSGVALTGATVFSDINVLNGVVTGEITTRVMTLANLGFTGDADANNYTLIPGTSTVIGGVQGGTDISIDGAGEMTIVNDSHTHNWSNITSTPTTLSGYGIVDSIDSLNDVNTTTSSPATGQVLTYDGSVWKNQTPVDVPAAFQDIYYYTATASQTVFTGVDDYGNTLSYDLGSVLVVIDGWVQQESDYTAISGNTVEFTLGLNVGDQVMIIAYEAVAIPNVVRITGDTMTGDLVVPNLTVTGTLTETSARKYKENIVPLTDTLEKVNQLEGVTYNKIQTPEIQEIGFIADDVNEVFPEVVQKTISGEVEGIHYARMTAILLEAVKDLTKLNQELTERVAILEEK